MSIQELVFAAYLMNFSPIAWRYLANRMKAEVLGIILMIQEVNS